MLIEHVRIMLLSISEIFLHERDAAKSHLEKSLELLFRKITLEPIALFAIGIRDKHSRRPRRVEAMKVFCVFFDVNIQRNEILVDE